MVRRETKEIETKMSKSFGSNLLTKSIFLDKVLNSVPGRELGTGHNSEEHCISSIPLWGRLILTNQSHQ